MISSLFKSVCITAAILLFVMPTTVKAQSAGGNAGIKFIENSWGEALKQAKKQNKYIFVDAYAVWCGPCKMLKRTTFRDKQVADFFNKNFINLAMDMEQGQGPELGSVWGLQAYPTLIVFNAQGKRILHTVGFIQASQLLQFGKQALAAKAKKKA